MSTCRQASDTTHLVQFERQNLISCLPDLHKIRHRPISRRLLHIQRALILRLGSVPHEDTVRHHKRPLVLASLLARQIPHFRYILPFLVRHDCQPSFQIHKLLLNLWPFRPMMRQLGILPCLPNTRWPVQQHTNTKHKRTAHLRVRLRASIFRSTASYILSASSSSCSYVVPANNPYSLSGS